MFGSFIAVYRYLPIMHSLDHVTTTVIMRHMPVLLPSGGTQPMRRAQHILLDLAWPCALAKGVKLREVHSTRTAPAN